MSIANIHLYQIVIVVLAAGMIFQGIKNFSKSGQTFLKLSVRLIVWGGMALVAIFPSFTTVLARVIGLEGNINAVILSGFLLIFLMIFKILSALERLEQHVTELTKRDALKEVSEKIESQKKTSRNQPNTF